MNRTDITSDFVYGGVDGTITTFAIMIGAIGSGVSSTNVIILSLASLFADGFSMGVSSYESVIDPGENAAAKGLATFSAFVAVGAIPIWVYYVYRDESDEDQLHATVVASLMCLFLIGLMKGVVMESNALRSGLKTMSLGAIAGGISYGVANNLKNSLN